MPHSFMKGLGKGWWQVLHRQPLKGHPCSYRSYLYVLLLKLPSNKCRWFIKWLYAGHRSTGSQKPHQRADSGWWSPAAVPIWQPPSLFRWWGMYCPQEWAEVIPGPFIRKFHLVLHWNSSPCDFWLLDLSLTSKGHKMWICYLSPTAVL